MILSDIYREIFMLFNGDQFKFMEIYSMKKFYNIMTIAMIIAATGLVTTGVMYLLHGVTETITTAGMVFGGMTLIEEFAMLVANWAHDMIS